MTPSRVMNSPAVIFLMIGPFRAGDPALIGWSCVTAGERGAEFPVHCDRPVTRRTGCRRAPPAGARAGTAGADDALTGPPRGPRLPLLPHGVSSRRCGG